MSNKSKSASNSWAVRTHNNNWERISTKAKERSERARAELRQLVVEQLEARLNPGELEDVDAVVDTLRQILEGDLFGEHQAEALSSEWQRMAELAHARDRGKAWLDQTLDDFVEAHIRSKTWNHFGLNRRVPRGDGNKKVIFAMTLVVAVIEALLLARPLRFFLTALFPTLSDTAIDVGTFLAVVFIVGGGAYAALYAAREYKRLKVLGIQNEVGEEGNERLARAGKTTRLYLERPTVMFAQAATLAAVGVQGLLVVLRLLADTDATGDNNQTLALILSVILACAVLVLAMMENRRHDPFEDLAGQDSAAAEEYVATYMDVWLRIPRMLLQLKRNTLEAFRQALHTTGAVASTVHPNVRQAVLKLLADIKSEVAELTDPEYVKPPYPDTSFLSEPDYLADARKPERSANGKPRRKAQSMASPFSTLFMRGG